MLSCFVRNVQFLWQNKLSNPHAVQVKWKVFKCGESRLLDGKEDNMNMYRLPPRLFPITWGTGPCLGHTYLPAFHSLQTSKKLHFVQGKSHQGAGECKPLRYTLLSGDKAGPAAGEGGASMGPSAPGTRWPFPWQNPSSFTFGDLRR